MDTSRKGLKPGIIETSSIGQEAAVRVLVTGALGYVGYAVARRLIESSHEIVALTHRADAAWPDDGAVRLVHGDVRDRDSLRHAVAETDAVCHLAALTRVRESHERPEQYAAVNFVGTENLLAVLAERGRPVPFVHASTAVVYGTPHIQPIAEDCELAPSSPYGATKVAADDAIRDAALAGLVGGVSLRGFNIAGAIGGRGDPDTTRIIPKAVAVASGRFSEVQVNGNGTAVRDFVHVTDFADAFALAMEAAEPGRFEVFNVGATGVTVAQIIAVTRTVTGHRIPAVHNPPAREAPELRADTSRIRARLGWKPQRSTLEQIITDAWEAEQSIAA